MNAVAPLPLQAALPYAGRDVALLTRHGKQALLAPVLEGALGCRVRHVDGYDTDLLGTFTRDVPRAGTQVETARRKARIGMQLAGTPIGLASEGSFGIDPMFGLIPWNFEVVLWLDDARGLEVVGRAQARACHGSRRVSTLEQAGLFARQHGFPGHGLIVRPGSVTDPRIRKDVLDADALRDAFAEAMAQSADGFVSLEVDARAHRNPTRRAVIVAAARDLAERLRSACPACSAPGFALAGHERGLPCADCDTPTGETRAEVHACVRCEHREVRAVARHAADPAHCAHCNP